MYKDPSLILFENFTTTTFLHYSTKYLLLPEYLTGGENVCMVVEWDRASVDAAPAYARFLAAVMPSNNPSFGASVYTPLEYVTQSLLQANNYTSIVPIYHEKYDANSQYLLFAVGRTAGNPIVKQAYLMPLREVKRTGAFKFTPSGYQV